MHACQGCGSSTLTKILDLGEQPICNKFIREQSEIGEEKTYPLELAYCSECHLVQLTEVPPLSEVFGEDFNYLSGSTPDHVEHFDRMADRIGDKFQLEDDRYVIDIGSNDGTFLSSFDDRGYKTLGIEPAPKPAEIANKNGIQTLNERFEKTVEDIHRRTDGRIGVVTAMNVLAHTDDIHGFLEGVSRLLAASDNGIFVSQSHYLPELVKGCEYDTIYHEHARYFSLSATVSLLEKYNLEVFDIERSDYYGGSLIVYAAHADAGRTASQSVEQQLEDEAEYRRVETYREFAREVEERRNELQQLIKGLHEKGNKIVGVGAPMKSSTLLNYCNFNHDTIEYITEVNDLKIGTYTPGTHIPVVEEDHLLEDDPDVALILSWNVADRIMEKLRSEGYSGSFVVPIPEPQLIK